MTKRARRAAFAAYVVAWIPVTAVLWAVLYVSSAGRMPPGAALGGAAATVIVPMIAGVMLWRAIPKLPSPDASPFRFAAAHALCAVLFVAVWTAWEGAQIAIGRSNGSTDIPLRMAVTWQAFIGLVTYVLLAVAAHAVRQWLTARDLRVAAERAERLRAQAELASLRAHVNPHFLFNTLHSIATLVRTDAALAERAIEELSSVFSYILRLDRDEVDVVTLEEEWEFTQRYLWLEQLRMGERLSVEASLTEDAVACAVPPFTLQPLVENAIRHGLSPKPTGGRLTVRAEESAGRIRLAVADDGIGQSSATSSERGLGVRAVTQRLLAQFTGDVAIDVQSSPGAGYRISLTFRQGRSRPGRAPPFPHDPASGHRRRREAGAEHAAPADRGDAWHGMHRRGGRRE